MSGVIWNSVLAIVFLLDKCFTYIINLRQLPKIWDENWLTIQSVPSQRHNTMVRRQIWFYIDVEEHNERLAALIVSNRVSLLNAHWVKSIFFLQCSICERERERHSVHNRASIVMGIIQKNPHGCYCTEKIVFLVRHRHSQKRHSIIQVPKYLNKDKKSDQWAEWHVRYSFFIKLLKKYIGFYCLEHDFASFLRSYSSQIMQIPTSFFIIWDLINICCTKRLQA